MEHMDGPAYSGRYVCEYATNKNTVSKPKLTPAPFFNRIWYKIGCDDALEQINNTTTIRAIRKLCGNDIVFIPNIKPEFYADSTARIVARDYVEDAVRKMGFIPTLNHAGDMSNFPDIRVRVSLKTPSNLRRIRVLGAYMMFDKQYMLTDAVLYKNTIRTR